MKYYEEGVTLIQNGAVTEANNAPNGPIEPPRATQRNMIVFGRSLHPAGNVSVVNDSPPTPRSLELATLLERFIPEAIGRLSTGFRNMVTLLSDPSTEEHQVLKNFIDEHGVDAALTNDSLLSSLRKGEDHLVSPFETATEKWLTEKLRSSDQTLGVTGEEWGTTAGTAEEIIIDPIDGTVEMVRAAVAFAFGRPIPEPLGAFGFSLGVLDANQQPIVGNVIELEPTIEGLAVVNEWLGVRGRPTMHRRNLSDPFEPLRVRSTRKSLLDARVSCTVPPIMFKTLEEQRGFTALVLATEKPVATKLNCVGFMRMMTEAEPDLVQEGDIDIADVVPNVCILEGAGFVITDHEGRPLRFDESERRRVVENGKGFQVLAGPPELHAKAVAAFGAGKTDMSVSQQQIDAIFANDGGGYISKFSTPAL